MLQNCQAILVIAKELFASGSSENNELKELKFRATVNRAYYSVFLLGRMKTRLENETKDVHSQDLKELRPLLVKAGKLATCNVISDLHTFRKEADYVFPSQHVKCSDWKTCAENAVIQAGYALGHLEKL